jgi:hypothetical protein
MLMQGSRIDERCIFVPSLKADEANKKIVHITSDDQQHSFAPGLSSILA